MRAKPELYSSPILLVKTNFCFLFLQNYFEKRGISIVFFRKTLRYSISVDELDSK